MGQFGFGFGLAANNPRGDGGGGDAPGTATIFEPVADWAALSTVPSPRRVGDRAAVNSLGGTSRGVAQWTGSVWALAYGMFTSLANADAFALAQPVLTGAIVGIEESADDEEMAVRYQYEGGWARTANGQAYVWTSTDVTAVGNYDPSGIGVTRVGDLLAITSGGRTSMWRLHQFASGDTPDATARLWWVDAELPATGLVLSAYMIGDEVVTTDTELQDQGWPTILRTNGTITAAAGEITLATTAANATVRIRTTTTIAANTRVAVSGLVRSTVGNSAVATAVSNTWCAIYDGANALVFARLSAAAAAAITGAFFWTGSAVTLATNSTRDEFAYPTSSRGLMSFRNPGAQMSQATVNNREMAVGFRNLANMGADGVEFVCSTGSTAVQNASQSLSHIAVITYGTT